MTHKFNRARYDPLTSPPASPVAGDTYYDGTDNCWKFFNGTVWVCPGEGFGCYMLWAEENAALNAGAFEWSFGNGDETTNGNGIVVTQPGNITAISLNMADASATSSATVAVQVNGADVANISATGAGDIAVFDDTIGPIGLVAGDVIGFRTVAATGTQSGNRVAITVCNDAASSSKILQIQNTDVTTDINVPGDTVFSELFGAITINTDPGAYTTNLVAGTITINFPGIYKISGAWSFIESPPSATARANIAFWVERNSTPITNRLQSNYNRDASGHNEVSQELPARSFNAVAGDVIEIHKLVVAGGATASQILEGTLNYFEIERVQ